MAADADRGDEAGPATVEFGSVMFGFDSTSRWVIVDWLMNWTVREVSGASSLAKKAPAPGFGQGTVNGEVEVAGLPVIARRDAPLDADAQDVAAAVDDGDDGVVAGRGGGGPLPATY